MPTDPTPDRRAFLSTHAHVLACVAADPDARFRDLAERAGVAGRAVARAIRDLRAAGLVTVEKVGRRNRYAVRTDRPVPNPLGRPLTVADLIAFAAPE